MVETWQEMFIAERHSGNQQDAQLWTILNRTHIQEPAVQQLHEKSEPTDANALVLSPKSSEEEVKSEEEEVSGVDNTETTSILPGSTIVVTVESVAEGTTAESTSDLEALRSAVEMMEHELEVLAAERVSRLEYDPSKDPAHADDWCIRSAAITEYIGQMMFVAFMMSYYDELDRLSISYNLK